MPFCTEKLYHLQLFLVPTYVLKSRLINLKVVDKWVLGGAEVPPNFWPKLKKTNLSTAMSLVKYISKQTNKQTNKNPSNVVY